MELGAIVLAGAPVLGTVEFLETPQQKSQVLIPILGALKRKSTLLAPQQKSQVLIPILGVLRKIRVMVFALISIEVRDAVS